ncbi:hypothetical protein HVJ45_001163 [Campylobacter coli]|nr:hypothetical protein [Campylobacter coli]
MSFTDFYFDREEKRISNYARELVKDELESRENFADIFNSLQEFKNILEASLEDDVGGKIKIHHRKIKIHFLV